MWVYLISWFQTEPTWTRKNKDHSLSTYPARPLLTISSTLSLKCHLNSTNLQMYTIWPDCFPDLKNNLHIVNSIPSCSCLKISANSINPKLNAKSLHCIPEDPKWKKAPVHLSCLTVVSIPLTCVCLISCINQKPRNSSWGSPHIWNLYQRCLKILLLTIYYPIPPVLIVSPDTMQKHLPPSLDCVDIPSPLCFPVLLEKGPFLSTSLILMGALAFFFSNWPCFCYHVDIVPGAASAWNVFHPSLS